MAIEFDCPRCSATIRVPDAYSGRQGRCPQCNERLLVPLVAVPSAPPTPLAAPNTPAPAWTAPAPVALPETQTAIPATPAAPPISAAAPATLPITDSPIAKAGRTSRGKTSRYSRRRPSRALIVGIPVVGFLMLMAILALTIDFGAADLSGELQGKVLAEKSLPRTVVAWSEVSVSADDQQLLQNALAENPETFSSELLVCRLTAAPAGLEIQLTAASGSKWCAVNPHDAGQKALALWLKQQRERLGTLRRAEMIETLNAWCRDKVQQIQGQQVSIDAGLARDKGVLNATVDSLGYAVQGRVGKRLIRAAAEDQTGWLYFCVPGDAADMIVEGRTLAGDAATFPGHYDVVIGKAQVPTDAAAPAKATGEEPPQTAPQDSDMQPQGDMQQDQNTATEMQNDDAEMPDEKSEMSDEPAAPPKTDMFGEAMKGMFDSEKQNKTGPES